MPTKLKRGEARIEGKIDVTAKKKLFAKAQSMGVPVADLVGQAIHKYVR